MAEIMRILGIDYGERRIGLALSDALGLTARPLVVIEHVSIKENIRRIGEIVQNNAVTKIVVGLPLNMDGTPGKLTEATKRFGDKLQEELKVPVEYYDERLSTMRAERMLIEEADMPREKRKKVRDKIAASFILQAYLDHQSNQSNI